MTVPPEPAPVDHFEDVSGFDVLLHVRWADGSISRLTSAVIGVYLPSDAVENEDGAYYSHFPGLGPIPSLKQTINGVSDEVTFTYPGVPSELADLFDAEQDLSEGAEVFVGRVVYDDRRQMIGGATWIWSGEAGEFMARDSGGVMQDGDLSPATQVLSLKVGTQQMTRAGAQHYTWSDAQHQIAHPGDLIFSEMGGLEQGRQKIWPRL